MHMFQTCSQFDDFCKYYNGAAINLWTKNDFIIQAIVQLWKGNLITSLNDFTESCCHRMNVFFHYLLDLYSQTCLQWPILGRIEMAVFAHRHFCSLNQSMRQIKCSFYSPLVFNFRWYFEQVRLNSIYLCLKNRLKFAHTLFLHPSVTPTVDLPSHKFTESTEICNPFIQPRKRSVIISFLKVKKKKKNLMHLTFQK